MERNRNGKGKKQKRRTRDQWVEKRDTEFSSTNQNFCAVVQLIMVQLITIN